MTALSLLIAPTALAVAPLSTHSPSAPNEAPLPSVAWADFDNDGARDAVVVREGELFLFQSVPGSDPVECTVELRLDRLPAITAATWVDYDGDGWIDLFATASDGAPLLLRNELGHAFHESSEAVGIATSNPLWKPTGPTWTATATPTSSPGPRRACGSTSTDRAPSRCSRSTCPHRLPARRPSGSPPAPSATLCRTRLREARRNGRTLRGEARHAPPPSRAGRPARAWARPDRSSSRNSRTSAVPFPPAAPRRSSTTRPRRASSPRRIRRWDSSTPCRSTSTCSRSRARWAWARRHRPPSCTSTASPAPPVKTA